MYTTVHSRGVLESTEFLLKQLSPAVCDILSIGGHFFVFSLPVYHPGGANWWLIPYKIDL